MEPAINPETLKGLRKKRNWTQEKLADELHCTKEQVSRWERGKTKQVRSHLRERLTKVFGLKWEELTQPPKDEGKNLLDEIYPRTQLNVRVRSFTRTALTLVSMRYKVRIADVIGLAPLLFLITAELSLRRRKSNLDAIWEQVFNLERNSVASAPHLAPALNNFGAGCGDDLFEEEESIKQRDIFNRLRPHYDVEDHCPYTTYLQSLAKDLLKENDVIREISPPGNDILDYTIALDTLREVTGIGGDTKRDQELRVHVLQGRIELRECVSQRKELSSETYERWLDQKLAEANEVERARIRNLFGFPLDLMDKELGEID